MWDTFAMILEQEKRKLSIEFHDVHFHTQPLIDDNGQLPLHVTIQRGTGRFEVNTLKIIDT